MMFSPALMRVSDLPHSQRKSMHSIVMRSVAHHPMGHLTAQPYNGMRRFAERMLSNTTGMARHHGAMVVHAGIQTTVAAGTGAALGAISAARTQGLDATIKGHKVPMDIVGGTAATLIIPFLPAAFGLHHAALTAASTAVGVGTFRKTHDFLAEKKLAGSAGKPAVKVAGDDDEIIAIAQGMKRSAA